MRYSLHIFNNILEYHVFVQQRRKLIKVTSEKFNLTLRFALNCNDQSGNR